jgi:hypothetical protein
MRCAALCRPAELQPRALPRCRPGQRVSTKDTRTPIRRAWAGEARFERAPKVSKTRGLPLPHSPTEPSPGATPGWNGVQGHPGRWTQGHVRSPGVEPGSAWPSTRPVYLLRHERVRAATRCRPGPFAVRRRSRNRARRPRCPSWIRTTIHGFRGRRPAV